MEGQVYSRVFHLRYFQLFHSFGTQSLCNSRKICPEHLCEAHWWWATWQEPESPLGAAHSLEGHSPVSWASCREESHFSLHVAPRDDLPFPRTSVPAQRACRSGQPPPVCMGHGDPPWLGSSRELLVEDTRGQDRWTWLCTGKTELWEQGDRKWGVCVCVHVPVHVPVCSCVCTCPRVYACVLGAIQGRPFLGGKSRGNPAW